MSREEGWAALHLEMPSRVPRTEYSADFHWPLVEAVTGRKGLAEASPDGQALASREFTEAWEYAFIWSTLIHSDEFGPWRTRMGHAEYQANRADWDPRVSSPFSTIEEVLAFRPTEQLAFPGPAAAERRFNLHYSANQASHPKSVAMTGIYVTCVSGLIDLFGWDLLLEAAGDDPAGMGELTNDYCQWVQQWFDALAESDAPIVMVHDDLVWSSGPVFNPAWYREYVFPNYKKLIRPLVEAGKKIIFTADGDYTSFIDDIAAMGVSGFVMEPMTDMAQMADRYGRTHFFVGNADTRILLRGSKSEIEEEVTRCMRIGKEHPGFILAVGNHIPPNTPVESALWYDECWRRQRLR